MVLSPIEQMIFASSDRLRDIKNFMTLLPAASNPLLEKVVVSAGTPYFVGDVHGMKNSLVRAMGLEGFNTKGDHLFSVGDLVDRGPNSLSCLRYTHKNYVHAVLGNHEKMWIDALVNPTFLGLVHILKCGGKEFVEAVLSEGWQDFVKKAWAALSVMPYAIEVEWEGKRIGVTHAEPPAKWSILYQPELPTKLLERCLWERERFPKGGRNPVGGHIRGIDAVVVGHSIQDTPTAHYNVLNIDTGAFKKDGLLTMLAAQDVLNICLRNSKGNAELALGCA